MTIPIVIIHIGNQDYFQECVRLNSKKNDIYVIGDESSIEFCSNQSNVHHILYHDLVTSDLKLFSENFVNYSTNAEWREKICFDRVFFLHRFFETSGLEKVFHLDSDCLLLKPAKNIMQIIPSEFDCAYAIEYSDNPYHMVGCIHNAILTKRFCSEFIGLCIDVYCNKTKFHLIEPKIKWHREKGAPGGICDMTLYYLLWKEKMIPVFDLNGKLSSGYTFDHNINSSYGFLGENTYVKVDGVKQLYIEEEDTEKPHISKVYFRLGKNRFVRILSLHLQGNSKKYFFEWKDKFARIF